MMGTIIQYVACYSMAFLFGFASGIWFCFYIVYKARKGRKIK